MTHYLPANQSCFLSILPFCMREVWVITACMSLVNETASHYKDGLAAPDIEKQFYRLQGDLYSLCRVKFMRLAYLIGYATNKERSPETVLHSTCFPGPSLQFGPQFHLMLHLRFWQKKR